MLAGVGARGVPVGGGARANKRVGMLVLATLLLSLCRHHTSITLLTCECAGAACLMQRSERPSVRRAAAVAAAPHHNHHYQQQKQGE